MYHLGKLWWSEKAAALSLIYSAGAVCSFHIKTERYLRVKMKIINVTWQLIISDEPVNKTWHSVSEAYLRVSGFLSLSRNIPGQTDQDQIMNIKHVNISTVKEKCKQYYKCSCLSSFPIVLWILFIISLHSFLTDKKAKCTMEVCGFVFFLTQ